MSMTVATGSKLVPIFTMAAVFDAAQTQSTATRSIATIMNNLSCNLDTNQEAKGASTLYRPPTTHALQKPPP